MKNSSTLSEVTRRSCWGGQQKPDRRVSSDRAVSREPLAVAADTTGMDFEWCFGTSVLPSEENRTMPLTAYEA